jgi:plastocyanin
VFRPTIAAPAAVAALAIVAAGCGGSTYGASAQPATSEPAAKGKVVELQDSVFQPTDIEAKLGERITFVNKGQLAHTATATDGAKFDSGSLASGGSFEFVPKKAGMIAYLCTFHAGMSGTIKVT